MATTTPKLGLPRPEGHDNVTRENHVELVDAIDENATAREDFEDHSAQHEAGGTDEINLEDLPGESAVLKAHKAEKATDDSLGHITTQSLGMRNVLINGNFDIWQRGTSGGDLENYGPDRWMVPYSGVAWSRSSDAPPGSKYSLEVSRSGGTLVDVVQRVESSIAKGLVGNPVTISFYAKTLSDLSAIRVIIDSADSEDDFSSTTQVQDTIGQALSGSWERFEFHISDLNESCSRGFQLRIRGYNGTTLPWEMRVSQVQLEPGDIATPFEHRPIGMELALCQRYAQLRSTDDVNEVDLRPSMRITPTIVSHDGNFLYDAEL